MFRLFITIISAFLWAQLPAFGQNSTLRKTYEVYYGTEPNIESGTASIFHLSSLSFDRINRSIENKVSNKGLQVTARIANYGLAQLYLGGLVYGTFLHEYMGHHARGREFGVNMDLKYNFPGLGGDNIYFTDHHLPAISRQYISAGGPEATNMLAYHATKQLYGGNAVGSYIGNFLLAGKLIDGIFYIEGEIKPFLEDPNRYYRNNASFFSKNPVPNDPLSYVMALTESYGIYDSIIDKDSIWVQRQEDMSVYTDNEFIHDQYDRLQTAFLLAAIDPSLIYFFYGTYAYLVHGKAFIKPFMFNIHAVSFMPSVRAAYGDLGAENYFDVFFKVSGIPPFNVYYRSGGNTFDRLSGGGIEMRQIVIDRFTLDGQIDYWYDGREKANKFNVYSKIAYTFPSSPFSLLVGLGVKSKGGLMGKPYYNGLYGYIGGGLTLTSHH